MALPDRLKFGIFMAPFHPLGENPTLALDRDLELMQWLDYLGFDEAWIGEHHSAGWETIASPEVVIATAAERTKRLKLGTGVISITKSLALAHAADGIRVNCVCPGFVETDMWTVVAREQGALLGQSPEDFTRRRPAQVPLGRMEHPEDVARVIGFLASERAAYMTGQAINVTGGLIMH